jgi:N-acetyl-gamma-glutamyl-phosphate reductase
MYRIAVMKVGVAGASGYAGAELVRILSSHPDLDVVVATGQRNEGSSIAAHTPSLTGIVGSMTYAPTTADALGDLDVVFLALPHGASQGLVPELLGSGAVVIDLGADFRLAPDVYEHWYGEAHAAPELCDEAVYGLVERNRPALDGARLVAVPGCYPTATNLALGPFVDAGVIEPSGIIVDAISGVSGAGRATSDRLHFSNLDEDVSAYGLLNHRHTAEMEMVLGHQVLFTPHLAPMVRGMLATSYAMPVDDLDTAAALTLLHEAYDDETFIHVVADPPSTKWASGSNGCFVTARVDDRTRRLVVLSAIDNLGKGAAGQAVQCANVALGLPEATGLSIAGVYP